MVDKVEDITSDKIDNVDSGVSSGVDTGVSDTLENEFNIRGLKSKEEVEKALLEKSDAIQQLKDKLLKKDGSIKTTLEELQGLQDFKKQVEDERKKAEIKKLEDEKNYEEIIKRLQVENDQKLEQAKKEGYEAGKEESTMSFNKQLHTMNAEKKLTKMALEMNFRDPEDVQLRITAAELLDETGSFKEALANDKILELAKKRPDLIKQKVVEDSLPPSSTTHVQTKPLKDVPKTKEELIRLPYDKVIAFKNENQELYNKLMQN